MRPCQRENPVSVTLEGTGGGVGGASGGSGGATTGSLMPNAFRTEISRNGFPFVGSAGEFGIVTTAPSTGGGAGSEELADALVESERTGGSTASEAVIATTNRRRWNMWRE